MQQVSIKDAPACLNTNDKAMWVTGYNEAVKAMQCQGCDVPAGGVHQISEPASKAQQTAPRGKSWRNWELVDSPIGFPTYDSMVQYHCNPERVRELEEGRDMRMQTIDRLQAEIARLEGLLAAALPVAQQGVQPPFMYAIADGHGQPFFEEEGCVSSEAKDLQPEVDSLNETLDGEPPYKVVALYTLPTQQGLGAQLAPLPENIPPSPTLWCFLTKGMTPSALEQLSNEHDKKVYIARATKNWAAIRSECSGNPMALIQHINPNSPTH